MCLKKGKGYKNTSEKTQTHLYYCKLFKFNTTTAIVVLKIQVLDL